MATRGRDEVSLLINGVEWRYWSALKVKRSIDAYSSVTFTAPFEPEREAFRQVFRPFQFQDVRVRVGGATLFTGTLIDVLPSVSPTMRTVNVTAYALPGVLADADAPGDRLPLEWKGYGLRRIAEMIAGWFDLSVTVNGDEGPVFDKVALEPGTKPQTFLAKLAAQRNFVINDTTAGAVRFWKSQSLGNPVARFDANEEPVTKIAPRFRPRAYFSEITGFSPTKKGIPGSRYTIQNPWLSGILRPHSVSLRDTKPADVPNAVNVQMGRMFAEMASYSIPGIPTWRIPQGALWTPNESVMVTAPDAMIYKPTEMLIRDVILEADPEKHTASLEVVLPGSFSGETPDSVPWEE